ncbi:SRPBCC domain-containing protein [Marinobacter salicampi]|uniref:SRPBCC domain-containing protein n=1 Tax=Marinobacter salicampi TaxID=435907 RepID=UPI00140D32E7|nr:SRPBCC domain-containing protein [Marinobacter salicampi]
MDKAEVWGLLTRKTGAQGNQVSVCLKREFEHDPGRVWAMLTDSACLGNWLAPGTLDLRLGGAVKVDFGLSGTPIDSRVTALRHQRLLEYSWSAGSDPERPVRWELKPVEQGTLLKLTLTLPEDERMAVSCAGWDAHLEMLAAALEGINIHFPADRFRQAREGFSQLAG